MRHVLMVVVMLAATAAAAQPKNQTKTQSKSAEGEMLMPPTTSTDKAEEAKAAAMTEHKEDAGPQLLEKVGLQLPQLHGGALLWYYQPLMANAGNWVEVFFAQLTINWQFGDFGLFFNPRFRDTKFRSFFAGPSWVQELYGYWKRPGFTIKAGKISSRFGRFWDGSFYGSLPYFDGLKFAPEAGLSLEDTVELGGGLTLEYAAQFFPTDGGTNGAGPMAFRMADTLFIPGARKRNIAVLRLAPSYKLGDKASVGLGLSGQRFTADFPADPGAAFPCSPNCADSTVNRLAVDANLAFGPVSAFAEVDLQNGRHTLAWPRPTALADNTLYLWGGAQVDVGPLALRYVFSQARYDSTPNITETEHQPGIIWTINDHFSLYAEYVNWRSSDATTGTLDHSLNFVLDGHF